MLVAGHDLRATLEAIPRFEGLKVVQTLSAGVDAIVDHLPEGVTLCDASGVHDVGVAEWVLMAILASNRRLPELIAAQRAATWRRDEARGDELQEFPWGRFVFFSDPDGNGWAVQEIQARA